MMHDRASGTGSAMYQVAGLGTGAFLMDDARERQLYETIRLTNNSINMLATAVMEMRADIHSVYERQTTQLAAWEQRWRRFMGDTPNPYPTTDDPPMEASPHGLAPWE